MMVVFADTSFFVALLNPEDHGHAEAVARLYDANISLSTSMWVVVETANYFAKARYRHLGDAFLYSIQNDPGIQMLQSDRQDELDATSLYRRRRDKEWSLTDCHSMVLMRRHS